jgi:predicted RNA-binding Zn-ribbon protein involved in translation (DUF1610 family)
MTEADHAAASSRGVTKLWVSSVEVKFPTHAMATVVHVSSACGKTLIKRCSRVLELSTSIALPLQ